MFVRRSAPRNPRRGFTLIELLVVIAIIATLASLILPGVQNAREAARRTECMNNMRNIALAVTNFGTAKNGAFPYLAGGFSLDYGLGGTANRKDVPWTIQLLPYLDLQALYERLQNVDSGSFTANTMQELMSKNLKVFSCPDDPNRDAAGDGSSSSAYQNSNLSFAVNMGYIGTANWASESATNPHIIETFTAGTPAVTYNAPNYNFNTVRDSNDSAVTRATGVFWRGGSATSGSGGFTMSSDYISRGDGQGQTVMLSENLQAQGWASYEPQRIGFGLKVAEGTAPAVAVYSAMVINGVGAGTTGGIAGALNLDGNFKLTGTGCKINDNINGASEGATPRPSSLHPGIVNMMFCDGHGKSVAQTINDRVYAGIISSSGSRYGQDILSETDF